jgi:bifunctional enzyme CysN/CysC
MEAELLRFTTAGSVDDGKSTLIGRLLLDSGAILEDQMDAMERASRLRGDAYLDLALLTDGLKAEREQGITIDVAYRYFQTPRRKFIIADTPGHIQYTRNMVTGASTADLAVILVDARNGVVNQSRRHGFIASLLGIPHIVVAINKMDLVGYSEERFQAIMKEYEDFAAKLSVPDLSFIPVSALHGDNVVEASASMPWYGGPTLLRHLENVHIGSGRNLVDFRFPVQMALRGHPDFRGYAGKVASGSIMPGEEVMVLPSGKTTRIRDISPDCGRPAAAGDSVILRLEDELDVSRGDLIVRLRNVPRISDRLDCVLCWMDETPLHPGREYIIQHMTRTVRARVSLVQYRIDVDTLHREQAATLALNEIGRVTLRAARPLFFDPYALNRATGGFIMIDPATQRTVAAGMIRQAVADDGGGRELRSRNASRDISNESSLVSKEERAKRNGHRAAVLWFTGLSGSGKSTIARMLERRLFDLGLRTFALDGDDLRQGLSGDLGFSGADRRENLRRAAEVASLAFEQGAIVLCSFISPFAADRDFARSLVPEGSFLEIYMACDVETCRKRDAKGLYARAARGEIPEFTGLSSPYEIPPNPEILADTRDGPPEAIVESIMTRVLSRYVPGQSPVDKDE